MAMEFAENGLVAALAATAVSLAGAVYYELKTRGTGTTAQPSTEQEGKDQAILQSMGERLPVTIAYSTTTGTSKRYAELLQKELFALNISGFHFDVAVRDLASYNAEELEDERFVIFLIPTWTGGVPAATAQSLLAFVRDLTTDFRVSKSHYKQLSYAVFGLGNSEYDANWCRAATDLDDCLQSLSAVPLLPVCKGDDSSDQDGTFSAWSASLVPLLCEEFAKHCGSEEGQDGAEDQAQASSAGGGCGTCGTGASKSLRRVRADSEQEGPCGAEGCACQSEGGQGQGAGDCGTQGSRGPASTTKEWLPKGEWRRQKKRAAEEAERQKARAALRAAAAARAAHSASSSQNTGAAAGGGAASDESTEADVAALEYTEEDAINDRMIAESDARLASETRSAAVNGGIAEYVPSDDEDEGEGARAGKSAKRPASSSLGGDEEGGLVDLEDIGSIMARASEERKKEEEDFASGAGAREMVTPAQRKALTKEGYKIIGSHSAVKLCRWTKAQLRGRGGCYKHTLYGIQSYQCMEATPSLACANKCTFCWRHHKNPVGRSWRWKIDDPVMIVEQAIAKHVAMIKEFKGTPGVLFDRWKEAHTVRHCALSLVGEPIMYPHINKLVQELHRHRISTFLVTNAQFPEAIANLQPVTQLYVSVDAATKDVLRAVDRPLFADFWERFLASLAALKNKGQRTVYRLTLVKGQNCGSAEDIANYAELIKIGKPDFIEVKGVTWCGVSDGSDLTMANVPWHEEVRAFTQQLAEAAGEEYALAAEHAHSCCVLLAKTRFRVDGVWHTHIDYERFHDLMGQYYASGGKDTFTSLDYMSKTPDWAVFGAEEAGFDPIETRWRRNKGKGVLGLGEGGEGEGEGEGGVSEIAYKASESGCG